MIRLAGAAVALAVLAGCSSSSPPARTSAPSTTPPTAPRPLPAATTTAPGTPTTPTTPTGPTGPTTAPSPVRAGPTSTARASRCPFVASDVVRNTVGMRLGTVSVQRSAGVVVGCRIYALQNSPLAQSEHLPGPDQPVVEIVLTRYASPPDAAASVERTAATGANRQDHAPLACFQIAFYPPDAGRDWACAFAAGSTAVIVRTVVTSPALDAVRVTEAVRDGL